MTPRCSIVIPVHNGAGITRRCLDALLEHPPAAPVEIVVVDDASTDSTPALLGRYDGAVRVVEQAENAGFARACNLGAAAASGEHLVFLNNDTLPLAGWLDEQLAHAEEHGAAVVGSKLLFPNETVQHAGVVICTDGKPRHIYAGFRAAHPVVNRSRRFQAVTAACMLVRRRSFERIGGFDAAFHNGLEDVDLCLRLGERGEATHYCHRSVAYHLESVSRGRRTEEIRRNGRLFAERWEGRLRSDELEHYVADGMLTVRHRDAYPIGIELSPELATLSGARAEHADELLAASSRQVSELLREAVRLTSRVAELELGRDERGAHSGAASGPPQLSGDADGRARTCDHVLQRAAELELEILDLQRELAETSGSHPDGEGFSVSEYLEYRGLVDELRTTVDRSVPGAASVIVVSRGDEQLMRLAGRRAWHLPQTRDGTYLGHHPSDSADAIAQLERLRARGGEYLVVPRPSLWWLEHYSAFARHVERLYRAVVRDDRICHIFQLQPSTEGTWSR
jgi:GT2 family glycosyltransferase